MISTTPFRIRSFERRGGRCTEGQRRAQDILWPQVGLSLDDGLLDFERIFGRVAPCFLEIGFGSGQSLLALANARPDCDFIGIETHKPGIGALCLGMQVHGLTNLRVYDADAVDVLTACIPDASLEGVQLFFPDPWPKRRHHARRLVQAEFVELVMTKLKPNGTLHVATDWDDYAVHSMRVLSKEAKLKNAAGEHQFAERSPYRPIVTKFEQRALREKRACWELQFIKL